jgi:hypothetical protein
LLATDLFTILHGLFAALSHSAVMFTRIRRPYQEEEEKMKRIISVGALAATIGMMLVSFGYAAWQGRMSPQEIQMLKRLRKELPLGHQFATANRRVEKLELIEKARLCTTKITFLDGPPVKGTNRIGIAIAGVPSQSMNDAHVEIEYLMPSLPGKTPMMVYRATADRVGDAYEATLKLDMRGEWEIGPSLPEGKGPEKPTVAFVIS